MDERIHFVQNSLNTRGNRKVCAQKYMHPRHCAGHLQGGRGVGSREVLVLIQTDHQEEVFITNCTTPHPSGKSPPDSHFL